MSDGTKLRIEGARRVVDTTIGGLQEMARSYARPSADPLPDDLAADDLYPVPWPSRFKNRMGDKLGYIEAPDLEEIATGLIESWPELGFIETARIRYLWKDKGTSTAMGKCTKAGGFWPALAEVDFVIWLGAEDVRAGYFTRHQVEALLYHELCHITTDEEGENFATRPHDAEVFYMELRRYGAWERALSPFGQMALEGLLQRGDGMKPQRFGPCPNCDATIELAEPCPTCARERQEQMPGVLACTACGTVQEAGSAPLERGVCLECRAESALGMGDEGGAE